MIKADLITGFLGSGKTTFMKKYAEYLLRSGEKVGIIVNDYGAVNVDMMLLAELEKLGVLTETIAGACDADCHRRRFKTKLIALGMSGLTRVIIEPSGIFDVDEFFDVIREEPLDSWYEIGSVTAVVDPSDVGSDSEQSLYYLASQAACAGSVVFSKTQLVKPEAVQQKLQAVNSALGRFGCPLRLENIITKPWDKLTDNDFAQISNSGWRQYDMVKPDISQSRYSSLYFMNTGLNVTKARSAAERLLTDKSFGTIHRLKGFVSDNGWHELNATVSELTVKSIANGQDIIIVIGEGLEKAKIEEAFYK